MTLHKLCSLFDLPIQGGRLFQDVAGSGRDVLVFKLSGGRLVAYDAACPHAGAMMRPENELRGVLTCQLHQWSFDLTTGQCLQYPHPRCALREYTVEAQGLNVFIHKDALIDT